MEPYKIYQKDAKRILILIIILIIVVGLGCFYVGTQYSKTHFISEVSAKLNDVLMNNFSYVCYPGQDQVYAPINFEDFI